MIPSVFVIRHRVSGRHVDRDLDRTVVATSNEPWADPSSALPRASHVLFVPFPPWLRARLVRVDIEDAGGKKICGENLLGKGKRMERNPLTAAMAGRSVETRRLIGATNNLGIIETSDGMQFVKQT